MSETRRLRTSTSKPFTCLICGKVFESEEILNAHKLREHDCKILSPMDTTIEMKTIKVSDESYKELTKLGVCGDSMDDIIKKLLTCYRNSNK